MLFELCSDFEVRIAAALPLPEGMPWRARHRHASQFLWDQVSLPTELPTKPLSNPNQFPLAQNVFNKGLLSALLGRAVHLPDGSDSKWTGA